jgi:hypothetical protein
MMLVGAIASILGWSVMWDVLLPGAFLAAVAFPQGVDSAGGNAYLVVAGLLDALLFALPVMSCWKWVERSRKPKEDRDVLLASSPKAGAEVGDQVLLGEVLALRTILLNLLFSTPRGRR